MSDEPYELPPSIKVTPEGKLRGRTLAEISEEAKKRRIEAREKDPLFHIWQAWGMQLSETGGPIPTLVNSVAVLENDPTYKSTIWYDEFLQRIMTQNSPAREWGDADDIGAVFHMQSVIGITRIGRDAVNQGVIQVAHKNKKNCVRDWFDGLVHDGTPRVDHFFEDHFGAEAVEYTRAASRNFWLSLVARIYRPGCKVDNMIVLEGPQGLGKSMALKAIGGDYFAEQHESATNPKAFAEILQGKLLIEISEMDAFNKAEVNRVKQTISCPSDRFRASYGRYAADHPRTCIFVGTTNRDDWNRDETGARRFWPIACRGDIDVDSIEASREQFFAEAVARYKAGESWWSMPRDETKVEQDSRFQGDPWLPAIEDILKGELTTTTAHVSDKLNISIERRDRGTEMRIGACLKFLGWGRKRQRVGRDRTYLYFKVGTGGDDGDKKLL